MHVGYFLAAIEDPFQIFPLESVASSMGDLMANSTSRKFHNCQKALDLRPKIKWFSRDRG
jgi:hypothetical protein